jgi:membrane associated rhomboid family serine protease
MPLIVIPTGTDAPIYHWPYATVGLIVLNVALAFLIPPVSSEPELDENDEVIENSTDITNFERYALTLGDGRLHPVQWVTHNFLHYGIIHLAGNMLFLWAFGIVVEGKLGALKYLLAYLTIGTLHGALSQTLLMRSGLDGHAAGASAVIYGLLAACMIWAPRNELNCTAIIIAGFRVFVFDWDFYYTTVALLYIGEQALRLVFWSALGGDIMVSEMGHLSGAFWGAVVAIFLLKTRLVDCEGWDLFTVWAKYRKLTRDWQSREKRLDHQKESLRFSLKARARAKASMGEAASDGSAPSPEERGAAAVRRVQSLIDRGDISGAVGAYDKAARTLFNWPSQSDLYGLIKALQARGAEAESIRLMRDHCRHYPGNSAKMRLKLAQVLMLNCQRPTAALRVLEEVPPGSLAAELETVRQKLVQKARQMCAEGVLELEGDD